MKNRKIIGIFIGAIILQLLAGVYILNLAKERVKKENIAQESIKTDNNYVLYLGNQKITFKDLNNSMVLYKNVTMKLKNGKLDTIASFGMSSISKKEKINLLKIIKDIEKAKLSEKEIKEGSNPIIVSGPYFYISIFKKGKCYIYKITNNKKTILKYFKYCQ